MHTETTISTKTTAGYNVKDLLWKPLDNIYVGKVQDPITGRPELHDGYITCTWLKNGALTLKYGGSKRIDLYLDIK